MTTGSHAVKIDAPGCASVRLGPLCEFDADSQAANLRFQLTATSADRGHVIDVIAFDPAVEHHGHVPVDVDELVDAMRAEHTAGPAPFPDLFSRLWAQEGYDMACRLWHIACCAYSDRFGLAAVEALAGAR